MSDSEDDYMKDDFLKQIPDVRPGISKNREHKRQLKILSNQDSSHRQLPKHELEAKRRHEALSKPVPETNKGFSLMAKMGYKPGMALGKDIASTSSTDRIIEPININVKLSRTGLGHDQMEKEQQQDRCEAHMKRMQVQAKMSDILATDYRKRKRNNAVQRILIADIMKSRKACQDLDLRCGIGEPSSVHLWPVRRVRDEVEELPQDGFNYGKDIKWKYIYSNGSEAPPEEDLNELDDEILLERLEHVTKYVRTTHFYCVWCGSAFDDADELEKECPGATKENHD